MALVCQALELGYKDEEGTIPKAHPAAIYETGADGREVVTICFLFQALWAPDSFSVSLGVSVSV